MFAFNPLYLLIIIPALLALFAQARVRQVYDQYGAMPNGRGLTGQEMARLLLSQHGLNNVAVERTAGHLTDHYDPTAKKLRLSDGVANARSITALGVVAHEVGHAVQDAEGYRLMRLRAKLAQRLEQMTQWSSIVFIGGMLLGISILTALGGVLLAGLTIFAFVTLPVERNASTRALKMIEQAGLATNGESSGARQVLRVAAFTHLANLGNRLATFLFFVFVVLMARGA